MFSNKKLIKNKAVYIYTVITLSFSIGGFSYGWYKFDTNYIETIFILGQVNNKIILPPTLVNSLVSKPSFYDEESRIKCFGFYDENFKPKSSINFYGLTDSMGLLQVRSQDLNFIKNNGIICIDLIVNLLNKKEKEYIDIAFLQLSEKKPFFLENLKSPLIILSNYIEKPYLRINPNMDYKFKLLFLGIFTGLIFSYGISRWLKQI